MSFVHGSHEEEYEDDVFPFHFPLNGDADSCQECFFEAWERMTFGGVVARYDDIVPNNSYTEIDGKRVSYPLCS